MKNLAIPPDDILWDPWLANLRQLAQYDLPGARRAALLRLLWQQAYQTRQNLIRDVEWLLRQPCFGPAAFPGDIAALRQALTKAGYLLHYSRHPDHPGYYIKGRPALAEHLRCQIAGALAEVDPAQMAIYRRLTPAQRVAQLAHLSDWLRTANEYRLQRRKAA